MRHEYAEHLRPLLGGKEGDRQKMTVDPDSDPSHHHYQSKSRNKYPFYRIQWTHPYKASTPQFTNDEAEAAARPSADPGIRDFGTLIDAIDYMQSQVYTLIDAIKLGTITIKLMPATAETKNDIL